ncbi:putative fungal-specific transcription factor, partial [Xylona heveae TC161]
MSSASETVPLTQSPSLGQQEAHSAPRPRPKTSRRRHKPQLSCNLCRLRKIRCDRQQPCSTCSLRGQTCIYPENHTATPLSRPPRAATPSVHDRLVQLERHVMSLMADSAKESKNNAGISPDLSENHGSQGSFNPADSEHLATPMDGQSDCGSMHVGPSELRYVGGDHWAAILDGIADLKDHFDREEQLRLAYSPDQFFQDDNGNADGSNPPARPDSLHTLLLYGCPRPRSRAEILEALPPKSAVDRYVSRYFNYLDLVASSAVHGPSFLREASTYENFWANPSSAPIMWVGLLFSMICLAVVISDATNEAEQLSLQIGLYREKIVQCLILGEYTKGRPYVLETVIHYLYVEFCMRADADKDIWFLLALEVNLAMRMGCHRDPSHFPGISPLQGEMRRRLWTAVLIGDILISSQMGMPRMISDWQCDTAEPQNLNDADLDEDTTELPPQRPETEHTTALGAIARRRMAIALGTIMDLTDAVKPCSYAEVMRVDGILHDAAASIPAPLKMKPMAASITDSAQVIMARLFISHMFYKGQIMLHRRFLYMDSPSRDEDPLAYSRKACLDAALSTLEIQRILDEETCPGGQLHAVRWRLTSSIHHQFLTATMILCSLLHRGKTLDRKEEILTALRRARTIWIRRSSISQEAKKAADTVSIVLARARDGGGLGLDMDDGKTGDAGNAMQAHNIM